MSEPSGLNLRDLQPRVGERFTCHAEQGPVPLVLDSVDDRGPGFERDRAFTVLFRGPFENPLDQRMHRLENEELGEVEIFLVPVEPDSEGLLYEGVFN